MDLNVNESPNSQIDIIFDRAAETSTNKLMAGGYYYVRNTFGAKKFFQTLVKDLEWWYVPGIYPFISF